jgi:lipoate-protein ligase B
MDFIQNTLEQGGQIPEVSPNAFECLKDDFDEDRGGSIDTHEMGMWLLYLLIDLKEKQWKE